MDEYRRTETLQNTRQVLDLWREWEASIREERVVMVDVPESEIAEVLSVTVEIEEDS